MFFSRLLHQSDKNIVRKTIPFRWWCLFTYSVMTKETKRKEGGKKSSQRYFCREISEMLISSNAKVITWLHRRWKPLAFVTTLQGLIKRQSITDVAGARRKEIWTRCRLMSWRALEHVHKFDDKTSRWNEKKKLKWVYFDAICWWTIKLPLE